MEIQIISRIIFPFIAVFPGCLSLRGDSNAVCNELVSYRRTYITTETIVDENMLGLLWIAPEVFVKKIVLWRTDWRSVQVCCSGYEDVHGTCEPKCYSTCQNGYCAAPNTCACNTGYKLNANGYTCEPVCPYGCEHGFCARPNICACHSGYEKNFANKCVPICTKGCLNGRCVSPNVCSCNIGFQRSQHDAFVCEPKCSERCVFGKCTAPETCTCDNGYRKTQDDFICEPICSEPCVFAKCTAPNTCACDEGYAFALQSTTTCEPICLNCENGNCTEPDYCDCFDGYIEFSEPEFNGSSCRPWCNDTCTNGDCTAPFTCTCNSGFEYNSTTTDCDPVCIEPCVNGFCESPETCQCFEGYVRNSANSSTCEAVCENCVNGTCVAPDECVCNDGFFKDDVNDGSCIPTCEPECIHGTCTIEGCDCLYGWTGKACEEPHLCVITQPVVVNLTEAVSELPSSNDTEETTDNSNIEWDEPVTENPQIVWDGPVCHSKCLDQLNTTAVNSTEYSDDVIYHFVPIDSSCNFDPPYLLFLKKHSSVLASALGISFLAVVIGAVYTIVRRKRRAKYTTNEDSGQSVCMVDSSKS